LPAFQQYLASFVARAVNAYLGRDETFWAPRSFSGVALGAAEDVVSKAAYTLANPVAAGLVQAGHLWPGLWSRPTSSGTSIRVKRPAHFFDEDGLLPEAIDLELKVPRGFRSTADFQEQLQAELSRQEQEARREHSAFLGVDRVLAQRPFDRPRAGGPRGRIRPRVAARDKWKRIELLQRLKTFLDDYRAALEAWRDGQRASVFPAGTYLMRVAHGAACAAIA